MDKVVTGKSIHFDLESQNNDNNNSISDKSGHWTELLLESPGADDSGHFTASPETDNSGSSRGHSPLTYQDCPPAPPSSAVLVQQVCRSQKSLAVGDNLSVQPQSIVNQASAPVSVVMQSERRNVNNFRSPVGMLNKLNSQMPTSGEGDDGSHSTEYLRNVVENFNSLYKEKLKMIEDAGAQGDVYTKQIVMEKKASILECWAKDVCVQNIVLIHTVEELEKQAAEKLDLLQKKIHESTSLAHQHVSVIQKYENQAKSLIKDKETSKEVQKDLKRELDKLKSEHKRIRERIKDLEKDNESLVTLITRIRDMGVWDVDGLELHKRTHEHIFGLYPNLPGSEVQTVFTREKARKIEETDKKAKKLEQDLLELTSLKNESDLTLGTKERKFLELENEFKVVSGKFQHCQEECEHYKKSLIETQEKLLEVTRELQLRSSKSSRTSTPNPADAARHAEIQELLQELRLVKNQLNESVSESQSAKIETHMIRKEFNERLKSMHESQQSLQTELAHSFETHNQVQEKEAQLLKVNEELRIYQSKCDAAEQMISKKDNVIEELQQQVQKLNKKEFNSSPEESTNLNASEDLKSTVSHAVPTVITCGRNHLLREQIQNKLYPVFTGINNEKPPWNDHFVKASSLEHSSKNGKSCKRCLPNERNKKTHSNSSDTFLQDKGSRFNLNHASNFNTNGSFSLCSCGSHDVLKTSSADSKVDNEKQRSRVSLPKVVAEFGLKSELNRKPLKCQTGLVLEQYSHLPEIPTKKLKSKPFLYKEADSTTFPKIGNPFAQASAYDLLMNIAVETSKKMLASAEESCPDNQVSSIRVVAGHKKRNQLKSRFIDTKIEKWDSNRHQKQGSEKFTSSHHKSRKEIKDFKENTTGEISPTPRVKFKTQPNTDSKYSLSLENLLSELPDHSFMNVVQEWMEKSNKNHLSENGDKDSNVSRRKHSSVLKQKYKISKQRSGRKTPRQMSGKSNSSMMFTAKKKLVTDISDIKEEWSRVFGNLDENISRTATEDRLNEGWADEPLHSAICSPILEATTTTEQRVTPPSPTRNNVELEQLKIEFQAEKTKMENEFQKELKDKDIEITMQKLTIQHLQGALVAMKRGQPMPIPQSSIGKPNGIASAANSGKVFEI